MTAHRLPSLSSTIPAGIKPVSVACEPSLWPGLHRAPGNRFRASETKGPNPGAADRGDRDLPVSQPELIEGASHETLGIGTEPAALVPQRSSGGRSASCSAV